MLKDYEVGSPSYITLYEEIMCRGFDDTVQAMNSDDAAWNPYSPAQAEFWAWDAGHVRALFDKPRPEVRTR